VLSAACTVPSFGFIDGFSIPPLGCSRGGRGRIRRCARGGHRGPAWTIVGALGDNGDARFESPPRCAQLTENFAQIMDPSAHLMALASAL